MPPNFERTAEAVALTSIFRDDMLLAIAGMLFDGKERGFHIYRDRDMVGHTSVHVGSEGEVELKLKELPFETTDFLLVSFHTHNGGNGKPSVRDIQTALALGEDLMCIGCVKNNRPDITCWKISVQQVL